MFSVCRTRYIITSYQKNLKYLIMFENHVKMGKMIDSVTAHMPLQESINPCLQYVDQDAANAPFEAVA